VFQVFFVANLQPMKGLCFICGLLLLLVGQGIGYAQNANDSKVSCKINFLTDSVKVGEPIAVTVLVKHPINTEVLFPDTHLNIEPLTIIEKNWFATKSDSVTSTDSAVYWVTTWQPAMGYSLSFPIYLLDELGDSTIITSNTDTLYFKSVFEARESKGLKPETNFVPIAQQFNYPYWILGGSILLVVLVALLFFFAKPIQRGVRLLLLWRTARIFDTTFDRLSVQAARSKNIKLLEQTLNLWKQHLERLTDKAFTTYTSKDFYNDLEDEQLLEVLQRIDRGIYGGSTEVISPEIFPILKGYAVKFYKERRLAINNE
jgi:hypothetical protein